MSRLLLATLAGCIADVQLELPSALTSPSGDTGTEATTPSILSDYEQEILDLINAHRAKVGAGGLIAHEVVQDAARGHSEDMADGTVPFGHDGFSTRVDVIQGQIGGATAGENVAMGYPSAESVVDGWLGSDGHRANIENPTFELTGVSAIESSDDVWYYTQVFIGF